MSGSQCHSDSIVREVDPMGWFLLGFVLMFAIVRLGMLAIRLLAFLAGLVWGFISPRRG